MERTVQSADDLPQLILEEPPSRNIKKLLKYETHSSSFNGSDHREAEDRDLSAKTKAVCALREQTVNFDSELKGGCRFCLKLLLSNNMQLTICIKSPAILSR